MKRWPHQEHAVQETLRLLAEGEQRICITSPTGGGKTVIACDLIERFLEDELPTVLYTNRRILIEQTSRVLETAGLSHGLRAAGHGKSENLLQVSMIQTEQSRLRRDIGWELHDAQRVIVDEAHLHKSDSICKIIAAHVAAGAVVIGLTATPIEIGHVYHRLVIAGMNSELRACGALVPAIHYGPEEPDLKGIKVPLGEDLTEKQIVKAMMRPKLFGRVSEWFSRINPERRPTILFAPGVRESVWFAEQFCKIGVPAAHIDGDEVWINGEWQRSKQEVREHLAELSRSGSIVVICNRFVLREGVDYPWLAHGIFATVFGSLQSYLQSGGRLLRSYPGMDCVTIQDHGGNWWRHGSLNADRTWELTLPPAAYVGLRAERMRQKLDREPWRCPQCAQIMVSRACECGFEIKGKRSRPVVTEQGELIEYQGDIFTPRRVSKRPDGPAKWKKMYWRSRTAKGKRTFAAAEALFAAENNSQWPDRHWPLMPKDPLDFYRKVADVPMDRLISNRGREVVHRGQR